MALGTAIETEGSPSSIVGMFAPISIKAGWQTVMDATGITTQDAATITNPTTQITASTKHIFQRRSKGTNMLLRMKYDTAITTTIVSPVVKVFGRVSSGEAWQLLYSKGGNLVETLTVDTTNDARDGTFSYTTPSFSVHSWDCLGCDEIIVGVQTAFTAANGTPATAIVQAKFI